MGKKKSKKRSSKKSLVTKSKKWIIKHKGLSITLCIAVLVLGGVIAALIWKHNLDVEHEQYLAYRESLTRFQTYFDRCDTYDDGKTKMIDANNPHKMTMSILQLEQIPHFYDSVDDSGDGHHRYKCLIRELGMLDNNKFLEDLKFQAKTENKFSNKIMWQSTYEGKDNILVDIQTTIPPPSSEIESLARKLLGQYIGKDVVFTLRDKETENKD